MLRREPLDIVEAEHERDCVAKFGRHVRRAHVRIVRATTRAHSVDLGVEVAIDDRCRRLHVDDRPVRKRSDHGETGALQERDRPLVRVLRWAERVAELLRRKNDVVLRRSGSP